MKEGDRISFVIADTLDLNGKPDDGTFKPLGEEVGTLGRQRRVYTNGPGFIPGAWLT